MCGVGSDLLLERHPGQTGCAARSVSRSSRCGQYRWRRGLQQTTTNVLSVQGVYTVQGVLVTTQLARSSQTLHCTGCAGHNTAGQIITGTTLYRVCWSRHSWPDHHRHYTVQGVLVTTQLARSSQALHCTGCAGHNTAGQTTTDTTLYRVRWSQHSWPDDYRHYTVQGVLVTTQLARSSQTLHCTGCAGHNTAGQIITDTTLYRVCWSQHSWPDHHRHYTVQGVLVTTQLARSSQTLHCTGCAGHNTAGQIITDTTLYRVCWSQHSWPDHHRHYTVQGVLVTTQLARSSQTLHCTGCAGHNTAGQIITDTTLYRVCWSQHSWPDHHRHYTVQGVLVTTQLTRSSQTLHCAGCAGHNTAGQIITDTTLYRVCWSQHSWPDHHRHYTLQGVLVTTQLTRSSQTLHCTGCACHNTADQIITATTLYRVCWSQHSWPDHHRHYTVQGVLVTTQLVRSSQTLHYTGCAGHNTAGQIITDTTLYRVCWSQHSWPDHHRHYTVQGVLFTTQLARSSQTLHCTGCAGHNTAGQIITDTTLYRVCCSQHSWPDHHRHYTVQGVLVTTQLARSS